MIKLFNEDCIEAMKKMPDKSYELAIVDPPYGIGDFVFSHRKYKYEKCNWNESIPNKTYFSELIRISKEQIIWGATYYNCFLTGGAIVWDKGNPHPSMSRCEIASYSGQRKIDYYKLDWFGFNCKDRFGIHPCEKPVKLYEYLLINYAKTGDKILDTHLGSGSIAIACYNTGFNLTGFELDKKYYEAAVKRLEEHKKQGSLFKPQEVQACLRA